jgi:uncharacterized hydrophobic protein (TIGR00341 family)
MPLRIVEIIVPPDKTDQVTEIVAGVPHIDSWITQMDKTHGVVRVLLEAEQTEALSDSMVKGFGAGKNFRLVSLPVESVLPPVRKPAEGNRSAGAKPPPLNLPARISREELYEDVSQSAAVNRVYFATVVLSTIVAAIGLIRDNVAIIIGAMVIAPLLGPNIALALAFTLGDTGLAKRAARSVVAGILVAGGLSFVVGRIFDVDPTMRQIFIRTEAGLADVAVALAAGTAGTLAFTAGVPTVVVGVMVAVALLPPLVVAGLLAGSGHTAAALNSLVILLVNITCVNLSAVATFLLQRVRPRTWWQAERARRATWRAVAAWVFMLAVLLALILTGQIGGI